MLQPDSRPTRYVAYQACGSTTGLQRRRCAACRLRQVWCGGASWAAPAYRLEITRMLRYLPASGGKRSPVSSSDQWRRTGCVCPRLSKEVPRVVLDNRTHSRHGARTGRRGAFPRPALDIVTRGEITMPNFDDSTSLLSRRSLLNGACYLALVIGAAFLPRSAGRTWPAA